MENFIDRLSDIPASFSPEKENIRRLSRAILLGESGNVQLKYIDLLRQALSHTTEAGIIDGLHGIYFELSRAALAKEARIGPDYRLLGKQIEVLYLALDRSMNIGREGKVPKNPQMNWLRETIDLDIPFQRKGLPYIYETKWCLRFPLGCHRSHWNQLFKYRAAVAKPQVCGVTYEVTGRISPEMLKWMLNDRLPKLQLIYAFPLPSGRELRLNLRQSNTGVQIFRKDTTSEDAAVSKTILQFFRRPNLDERTIALFEGFDHPEIKDPYTEITTRHEHAGYQTWFNHKLWCRIERLAA